MFSDAEAAAWMYYGHVMRLFDDMIDPLRTHVRTVESLIDETRAIEGIRKDELSWGDRLVVITANSTYVMEILDNGECVARGGWFETHGGGVVTRLSGCSWGGRAIHRELAAAPGLHLEFGNGVVTSEIRQVYHERGFDEQTAN